MPDSDLNIHAVDTTINAEGYMPGPANPTTLAEIKDTYMSSQFPTAQRIQQLQELRRDMVARKTVDTDNDMDSLIQEIDRGLAFLQSDGRGDVGPDTINTLDTAVDPDNL